jgi:quercetin dioxygenase-like cupin family protein
VRVSFQPVPSSIYRRSDDVEHLPLGSAIVRLIAPGAITSGRFGLFRWDMAPHAGGPAPHYHETFSESFYILDGAVRFGDGATWSEATAGDYLYVPERGIHAFSNDTGEPASMLILFAPGAPREQYFEEQVHMADRGIRLSGAELAAFYARHDQYMVDSPSRPSE